MKPSLRTALLLSGLLAAGNAQAQVCRASVDPSVLTVPSAAELKATAVRLLQPTNAKRLEQLQSMLRERQLPFELQPVPNPQQKGDTRAEGSNVLVTMGKSEAAGTIVIGAHSMRPPLQAAS